MHAAKYEKKALLIISDGGDNHSRYSDSEIKNLVKESEVQIYSIGYDHYFQTEEERLGPQLLSDISEISGGRAFSIENPNDLTDVAAKIGIELRNKYLLGYRPTTSVRDDKWHKLASEGQLHPRDCRLCEFTRGPATTRLPNEQPVRCLARSDLE